MAEKTLLSKELEIEILLRLRVRSLLRLKSVCKNWHHLIQSPFFITHYHRISDSNTSRKLLCFHKDQISQTHVISLFDDQITEKVMDLDWPPFLDEGVENKSEFHRAISIFGPVNGIYCIFNILIERWLGTLVLWNPATREYKHILPCVSFPFGSKCLDGWNSGDGCVEAKWPVSLEVGFGYDEKTNDFRIVVVSHWLHVEDPDRHRWHAKIYSLSTDYWRTIYYFDSNSDHLTLPFPRGDAINPFPRIQSYPGLTSCFLNNVIHWSCLTCPSTQDVGYDVFAFDIASESFHLIKGPPLTQAFYRLRNVWVLRETLAMTASFMKNAMYFSGTVEVWMMMKYGIEDSWAMLYAFGPIDGLSPVGIPNDDRIFFRNDKGQLISFGVDDHQPKVHIACGSCEKLNCPNNNYESLRVLRYIETLEPLS